MFFFVFYIDDLLGLGPERAALSETADTTSGLAEDGRARAAEDDGLSVATESVRNK